MQLCGVAGDSLANHCVYMYFQEVRGFVKPLRGILLIVSQCCCNCQQVHDSIELDSVLLMVWWRIYAFSLM